MGILENCHHVALGLAAVLGVVPGPARDPEGALEAAPAPGPEGALGAAPAFGPTLGAVAVAAAEGAAVLAVIWGDRDERRIMRSWLSFSTTFAYLSTLA